MPLFEYICQNCRRKFTWLIGMVADPSPPKCDRCGAIQAKRKEVSRFTRIRSDDQSFDDLSDPSTMPDMEDPSSMRRWAKDMGNEIGEDLGEEFDDYIDDVESSVDSSEDF